MLIVGSEGTNGFESVGKDWVSVVGVNGLDSVGMVKGFASLGAMNLGVSSLGILGWNSLTVLTAAGLKAVLLMLKTPLGASFVTSFGASLGASLVASLIAALGAPYAPSNLLTNSGLRMLKAYSPLVCTLFSWPATVFSKSFIKFGWRKVLFIALNFLGLFRAVLGTGLGFGLVVVRCIEE